MEEEKQELKKDKGCVFCRHIFSCKGRPKGNGLCLHYEDRRGKNGDLQKRANVFLE